TTPAQIARFKELKVIASMQPSHVLTDMRWAQDRLGPKRAATSYAWAGFLNKGVTLALDQAIAAYTTGSAFAEFEEKEKGRLAPGMLADFIVLDRDVTASSAEKVLATKVLRTVVGGKTVYEAE